MKQLMELTVNQRAYQVAVESNQTLLELLRDDLNLTGTKEGCGEGDCGACVVLLEDLPVNACLILALQTAGCRVTTIEGLAQGKTLDPIQHSFIEAGAVQCGYCTPGMILTTKAFLTQNPSPTENEVRHAISGNLCRCTGYQKIVEAILLAAKQLQQPLDGGQR